MARRCAYKKSCFGTLTFVVDCEYVDYNGTFLGFGTERLEIDSYRGHQPIKEINPLPTSFLPNIEDVRKRLTERGKAFEKYVGVHYKGYSGLYLPAIPNSFLKPRRRHVSCSSKGSRRILTLISLIKEGL